MKTCLPPDAAPRPPARLTLPAGACDTHAHIFGPAAHYPWNSARGYTPPDALPQAYEALHGVLGVSRGVLTQPSVYGTDNRCMLDYVARFPERMRAVVAVGPETRERDLETMQAQGARGIRVNIADPGGNPFRSFSELRSFGAKLKAIAWHVELLLHVHEMDDVIGDIRALPVDVSVGHLGYMPARLGVDDARYRAFLALVADGRCWVKLTAPYRITGRESVPYDDVTPFARALVAARPDRILWGTDWPHPICPVPMPNDGDLLDHLAEWIPDLQARHQVLVDNPARLYGF